MAASVGLGLLPAPAAAFDWLGLFGKSMPDMSGVVKLLEGQAFAEMKPLAVGDRVASGAFVAVARGGRLVISLASGAVFTLYGGSELELFLTTMRRGLLNLLSGALLLAVPRKSNYLLAGSDAAFGIKGTVVFRQVFGPHNRVAKTMEGTLTVPERASGYFCTCNGSVEYLARGKNDPFFTDRAEYHHSYYIDPARPGMREKAPMLNHNDEAIRHLIGFQEGLKHDLSWLKH